jgi:hypothetical protein
MGVGLVHLSPRATGLPRKLVSPAVRHSAPNLHSNGPAVLTDELPPQGFPFQFPRLAVEGRQAIEAGATSGSVLGRCRTFVSLGRELGGEVAQDFTKRRPRLGFDWLRHGFNHEGSHDRKVGKVCPVPGNVCRAR